MSDTAAQLLIEARQRAGLTQRALARAAGTSQSVVARIENGTASPSWQTLERLLASAGFALSAALVPGILRSKRAAQRPQDQQDVLPLREVLERSEK